MPRVCHLSATPSPAPAITLPRSDRPGPVRAAWQEDRVMRSGERGRGRAGYGRAGATAGLLPGTLLATPDGWRAVETLAAGDRLWTADHALVALAALAAMPAGRWRILVPAGVLGNRAELRMLPAQRLLVLPGPGAAGGQGGAPLLSTAGALAGWRGIRRIAEPGDGALALRPLLAGAPRGGMAALLCCPAGLAAAIAPEAGLPPPPAASGPARPPVPAGAAPGHRSVHPGAPPDAMRLLAGCLIAGDLGAALCRTAPLH
jgi:hypothetical protein